MTHSRRTALPRQPHLFKPLPKSYYRVGRSFAGLGLFAVKPIRKRQYIIRYTGKLISNELADKLDNRYMFDVGRRGTIDGSYRWNTARYANHSCRPNADSDIRKGVVKIRAIKKIKAGDEITYDYGEDYFDTWFNGSNGCKCPKCRAKRAKKRREQRLKRERRLKRQARARAKARAEARGKSKKTKARTRRRT